MREVAPGAEAAGGEREEVAYTVHDALAGLLL